MVAALLWLLLAQGLSSAMGSPQQRCSPGERARLSSRGSPTETRGSSATRSRAQGKGDRHHAAVVGALSLQGGAEGADAPSRPSKVVHVYTQSEESPAIEIVEMEVFTRIDPRTKDRVLTFYGLMLRSVAATAVHPLNVIKTMLQMERGTMPPLRWDVLSRGAGSQLIMSIPHGALNFVVTERTKSLLAAATSNSSVPQRFMNPTLDFLASSISTFACSVISTPQMVLTDRIMAGIYSNFFVAVASILRKEGIRGLYVGWFPAIVQKIPSYALTWMFFQQLKAAFLQLAGRVGTTVENTLFGAVAAAAACCIMIPVDTIKTRIVMQRGTRVYAGMIDCLQKIVRDEGWGSLYRALPPRLFSVVPMIGVQFAVYELMKRVLLGEETKDKDNKQLGKLT